MPTTTATGRDPTPAPSRERPVMAKYRTSQAERLATAAQAQARTDPGRGPPAVKATSGPSHLGRNIDVRA